MAGLSVCMLVCVCWGRKQKESEQVDEEKKTQLKENLYSLGKDNLLALSLTSAAVITHAHGILASRLQVCIPLQ